MPTIQSKAIINAPIEKCFHVSRDVEIYIKSIPKINKLEVESEYDKPLELGHKIYWAYYLYKNSYSVDFETNVIQYMQNQRFTEEINSILFKEYKHKHEFFQSEQGTIIVETITYEVSFGPIGKLIDHFFLENFIKKFVLNRKREIQRMAEK